MSIRMMNSMLRKALGMAAIFLVWSGLAIAQDSTEKVAFTLTKIAEPLPFKIGETLLYDVSFTRLVFSGAIGELKLTVSKPPGTTEPEMLELRADAVSKGFFPAL